MLLLCQGLTPLLNAPAQQSLASQAAWSWPFGTGGATTLSLSLVCAWHCRPLSPTVASCAPLTCNNTAGQQPLPLNPPPIAANLLPEVQNSDFVPYLRHCADTFARFDKAKRAQRVLEESGAFLLRLQLPDSSLHGCKCMKLLLLLL